MIRKPRWPRPNATHENSPFKRGRGERPISLTIHAPQDTQGEPEALALLRELVHVDELSFIDTTAGTARSLKTVEERDEEMGTNCFFEVRNQEGRAFETHLGPHDWWVEAVRARGSSINVSTWMPDVYAAAAHHSYEHDLLVTTSTDLLHLRDEPEFRELNILSPLEAVKLVGLFLRSRDCFVYAADQRSSASIDSWSFYLLLTRMKLPRLWNRVGDWIGDPWRTSEVSSLRGSVISRCRRAIEARDAIGIQFYLRNDNRTEDITLYHLDYLLLLLSGAIDALMLVVMHTHGMKMKERAVGFWSKEFRDKLAIAAPAILAIIVRADALQPLLAAPRNTIHSMQLRSMGFRQADQPAIGLVKMGQERGLAAMEAAQRMGGADKWGMLSMPEFPFEPYTYTHALMETVLSEVCPAKDARQKTPRVDS